MGNSVGRDARMGVVAIAVRLASAAAGLLMNVVLARILSVDAFGVFLLGLALASTLSVAGSAGVPFSALRFLSGYLAQELYDKAALFRRFSLSITWIGSISVMALAALVMTVLAGDGESASTVGLFASLPLILVFGLSQTYHSFLVARGQVIAADAVFNLLRPVLTIVGVLLIFLAYGQVGPVEALLVAALSGGIAALVLARVEGRQAISSPSGVDTGSNAPQWSLFREWAVSGGALLLITTGAVLNERLDILIVGAIAGTEEAAIYGVSSRIALIGAIVTAGSNAYFGPRIAGAIQLGDEHSSGSYARQAAYLSVGAMTLFLLVVILFGESILSVFGEAYQGGDNILLILVLSQWIVSLFGATGGIVVLAGAELVAVRGVAIGLVANLGLNLALTPAFGGLGAAVATLIASSVTYVFLAIWCRQNLGFPTDIFPFHQSGR